MGLIVDNEPYKEADVVVHTRSESNSESTDNDQEWEGLLDNTVGETELKRRSGWGYKLAKTFWDTADKPPKERSFMFKLDTFFLSSVCFGYFLKYLDQNNVTVAYANGMAEYLFDGKQDHSNAQQVITSCWTAGYIVGQIPSNYLVHRYPARWFLGVLELTWMALTFLTPTCNSYGKLCALRFFVGLVESGYFPVVEYLLGCWYSAGEITKRSTLFAVSGVAGQMVTSYFQVAVYKGLQHTGVQPPFKWLFIIDGVVSFPIALYTILVNPNTPETTTSWYFNHDDRQIALLRRKKFGARPQKKFTWNSLKKTFSSWHVYIFPWIFLAYNNSCEVSSQNQFLYWLEDDLGFGPEAKNTYPTAVLGTGIGFAVLFGWLCDSIESLNYPFVIAYFVCEIFGNAVLAGWNIPIGLHWFAYFATGSPTAWGQPHIFCWVNQLLRDDSEVRHIVVTLTNNLAYVTGAFVPILVWDLKYRPEFFIGWTYTACLSTGGLILTLVAVYLTYRDKGLPGMAKSDESAASNHCILLHNKAESISDEAEKSHA